MNTDAEILMIEKRLSYLVAVITVVLTACGGGGGGTTTTSPTPAVVDPNQIFATVPTLLPDLSDKFNSLCGADVGIQAAITANILGHKDGKKDIVAGLWCPAIVGSTTNTPTVNGIIVLTQQADGSFLDDTKRIFGVDLINDGGGVPYRAVAYDFNHDGYDEVFFSVTGEDGRSLPNGFTGYNRQNIVLTSSANGAYSVQNIGWPSYNYRVQIVDGENGQKDVLTNTIGYGGRDQAFRIVNNQWAAISYYDGGPTFDASYFSSRGFSQKVDSAFGGNLSGVGLYKNINGVWSQDSNWTIPLTNVAGFRGWNGDVGTMNVYKIDGIDYGFISFGDNCRIRRQGGLSSSLFAVPAQKIVGGYTPGRFLTESNSNDFQISLMLLGFEDSSAGIIRSNLTFKNIVNNMHYFDMKCSDFNGDGFDDVLIQNWGQGEKPNLYLQDNANSMSLINPDRIPSSSSKFNGAIALYEDIDGDGIKDIFYYPINGIVGTVNNIKFQIFKGLRAISPNDRLP